MIVERVTVTTTPTSIKALIDTARGVLNTPAKCISISLKYNALETKVVKMSDAKTANAVTILDNVTEGIPDCSFDNFDISQVLLNTTATTIGVDVIISQARI